jgi:peptidoglycan/LPS O-acetylase OafA/YrhL
VDLWHAVVEDGVSKRVIVSDHVFLLDAVHLAYVVVVIALSALSYRYVEQPGRRLFQEVANRLGKSTARNGPELLRPTR